MTYHPETQPPATVSPSLDPKSAHHAACLRPRWEHLAIPIATLAIVWPADATAATYYVDGTRGNDGNDGSEDAPVRTIAEGSNRLDAGDTLLIREGTYTEAMHHGQAGFTFTNGMSMAAMTRYSSYPDEQVVLRPPDGSFVVWFSVGARYIEVSHLILDGVNVQNYVMKIDRYTNNAGEGLAARHIRVLGNEILNGPLGIQGGAGCEIIGNEIHDIRLYGIYGGGSYDGIGGLYEGNTIHDCGGFGIHLYQSTGGVDNNVIRNNIFYANGSGYYHPSDPETLRNAPAVIISKGENNQFYNNVVYANHAGVSLNYGAVDTLVANNTVYGNETYGIKVGDANSGSENASVVNNLVWGNSDAQIANNTTDTTLEANFEDDPMVEDAAAADFRLLPDSPARDAGVTVPEVETDINGTPRPQDAAYDIGAFEFTLEDGESGGDDETGSGESESGGTGQTGGTSGTSGTGGTSGGVDPTTAAQEESGVSTTGTSAAADGDGGNACACTTSPKGGGGLIVLLLGLLGLRRRDQR